MRYAILAVLALVLTACSDAVSPTPAVSGHYRLVALTPSGANVALDGSLEMSGGNFVMLATFSDDRPAIDAEGSYSTRRSGRDHIVTIDPPGIEAVYSNGHIVYDHDGLAMRWLRE